jgi:hypothetical protein
MKTQFNCTLAWLLGAVVSLGVAARADLQHRYSFTSDASDSVGTANGTMLGDAYVTGGSLYLDGTSGTYVDLPAGMISNYTAVTFEFWISPDVQPGNWAELYAFGDRDAGGAGSHMLMFTPHSSNNDYRMSYADADPGYSHEFVVTQPGVLDLLGPIHIACVYDPAHGFMGLYTNGVLAAARSDMATATQPLSTFSLTNIANVHSWLGQSLYSADAAYNGTIDEFRVYDTAQNAVQIAGSFVAGPDTVSSDPGAPVTLHLNIKTPIVVTSSTTARVVADFAKISGVNLAGVPGVTFTSSNTNVATVDTNGVVMGVTLGSADITASYGGQTAVQTVNVTSGQAPVLRHRYSFTSDANDSVGAANGLLYGDAAITGGQVVLDGTAGTYVDFPNDMLTNYDSLTMEVWVTDNGSAGWARVWDFGDSSGGEDQQGGGTRYLYLSLPSGYGDLRGAYNAGNGEQLLISGSPRPPVGQKTHIVWTSDASFHVGKLYVNGFLVGVNTNMTITPRDIGSTFNDWLGRSQYNDPPFNGAFDEFRIYDGAISPLQVAVDAAAGPDQIVTNAGALSSVQLTVGTNAVIFGGLPVQATLLGNFANQANVNVTTLDGAAFASSDPTVATINAQGLVTATGLGTVTLTGSYGGQTNTLALTTVPPPGYTKPVLVHRYSFSDAVGSTTVKDSVGTADGTIKGLGASFDGAGQLSLPGGTASNADPTTIAAYVDLPNHIINVLTNATFEVWTTWLGSGSWQRIFDFGTSDQGEDISSGNGNYLFLSPEGPSALRFSVRDPVTGTEPAPLTAPAPLATNVEVYLAVVYDNYNNTARLYSNAVMVASGAAPVALTSIDDVNVWLGRSQWGDPMYQGKYNEVRIWSGAMLPDQIAADYAAGPDSLTALPRLTVAVSGTNIVLSWPVADGFVLQTSAQLGTAASWTVVNATPVVANGQNTVTLPIGTGTAFYRLMK